MAELVKVTWDDAWGNAHDDANGENLAEQHNPMVMETTGYLLRDDEKGISLSNEICLDDSKWRGRTFIPRQLVKSVVPVIKPRKSRKAAVASFPAKDS